MGKPRKDYRELAPPNAARLAPELGDRLVRRRRGKPIVEVVGVSAHYVVVATGQGAERWPWVDWVAARRQGVLISHREKHGCTPIYRRCRGCLGAYTFAGYGDTRKTTCSWCRDVPRRRP